MLQNFLWDSVVFYKNHFIMLSAIILPIVIPIDIFSAVYLSSFVGEEFVFSEQWLPLSINILFYPIYSIGVIYYMVATINGQTINVSRCWSLGIKYWFPYFILTFLVVLMVFLGFMFLIIPGIIIAIKYSFSEFELLINNKNPLHSLKSSWGLTKGYAFTVFGGFFVISVFIYAPFIFLNMSLDLSDSVYFDTMSNIIMSLLAPLYTVFTYRVYEYANSNKEIKSNIVD